MTHIDNRQRAPLVIPSLRCPKEEELTQQERQHKVALPPQQQPSTPKSDGNLADHLFFKAISQADLFWELDPCGRTRALRTLFEKKRMAVEVVSTCLCSFTQRANSD